MSEREPTPAVFDLIVVGAGLVGSAFVLALRQHAIARELRIAVVEQALPPIPAASEAPWGLRVAALSPESVQFLQDVGLQNTGHRCDHRPMATCAFGMPMAPAQCISPRAKPALSILAC